MDILTKAMRLKEYLRDKVLDRAMVGAGVYGHFLIRVRVDAEDHKYPLYWFEIVEVQTMKDEHLPFSFYAKISSEGRSIPIANGKLASEGEGFKIVGLAITQPLNEVLSPQETGAMLLARLDELIDLDTEQATLKLTGQKPDNQ